MPTALDEMFMAESMTDRVRRFAEQSRERSFIGLYEGGGRLYPTTDTVKWEETRFSRDLAPISGPSSPSKATAKLGRTVRTAPMLKICEHVDLDWRLLKMARGEGSLLPDPAGMLNDNLLNLTNRVNRTRNYWAAKSVLTTNGSVDPGSFPNADISAAAMPLVYPVASLSAANSWALAGTKIRSEEINRLKLEYQQNTGFWPEIGMGSQALDNYFNGNTEFSEGLRGGSLAAQRAQSSYETGDGVRYGGMQWKFAHDYYAADATPDTEVDVIADQDLVAILPPQGQLSEVFTMAEGIQGIPTGMISKLGTAGFESLIAEVRGWYAFVSLIQGDPIGIRLHVGWCGMLIQKMQKGVLVFNMSP